MLRRSLSLSLCLLAFWALFATAMGTILAMGLVVAYSDPFYLPFVFVGVALATLLFAFFAAGWKRGPHGVSIWGTFSLLTLVSLVVIRLLFPFFPRMASLIFLGLMEGYGILGLGSLRRVIETYLSEREKGKILTLLRFSAIGGGLSGGIFAIVLSLFTSELVFFWVIVFAIALSWVLASLCRKGGSQMAATPGLKGEFGGWVRLTERSALLQWLVVMVGGIYLFRTALVIETLTTYTALLSESSLLFFALLITASALVGVLFYGLFSWIRRPLGALGASLAYPILATLFTIVWLAWDRSLIGPLLASIGYLALMPTLFLREVQSALSLFPPRFSRTLGHFVFGFAPLLGIGGGGLLWIIANALLPDENRVILLLFLSLGLIGLAVGVGHSYRRAFFKNIPFRSPLDSLIALPRLNKKEGALFLEGSDPFLQELALKSGADHRETLFLPQVTQLLGKPLPKEVRFGAYHYLAAVGLGDLLTSENERVKRRAIAAALFYKIPLDMPTLTPLLEDSSGMIRAMGCILAWQQGLAGAAEAVWGKLNLNSLDSEGLCELIEAIKKPIPESLLAVIKKFAWYPNPKVRREAIGKLGELFEGGKKDPNLLEVALDGLASEDSAIREKSIPLLVASGADNRAVHIAACLTDSAPNVREVAGQTLADLGGYELALPFLDSSNFEAVEGAIRVLARSGSSGEVALSIYLEKVIPSIPPFRRFPESAPINVVLKNARLRALRRGAIALEARGDHEAAHILRSGHFTSGSLDLLYRLAPRPLIDPIAPLFKDMERERRSDAAFQRDLEILAKSQDPFIKRGANLALNPIEDDEMNRLLFLKSLPYFHDLLLEEIALLSSHLEQKEFLKGEVIFEEGSVGERFYLIYEGRIDLFHRDKHLTALKEGEGFGEMALFEEEKRSATAKAGEDTILLSLDKVHFHELIRQRPQILLEICKRLGERLREMDKRFSQMAS